MGSIELGVMAGIALAAACGLRAFLPLLAVGLAARFGHVHLATPFGWLAQNPALIALSVATVVEIAADKIPIVDHVLDVVSSVIRPLAAMLAVLGVLPRMPAAIEALIAFVAGGGAMSVHLMKAKARLGSTVATLGHANSALSVTEDFITVVLVTAALLAPIVAFVLIIPLVAYAMGKRPKRFGT